MNLFDQGFKVTLIQKYQHELDLWIYYMSKLLNTSEIISTIDSRNNLLG
jgi:hypothetical protein